MKLYNTLTRRLDPIRPIDGTTIRLYTCGLTVYSQPHIGNWLGYIYWDVLVRTLRAEGYRVERTQNITDVGHLTSDEDSGEDKMQKGARHEGMTAWNIADKYIAIADHEAYNVLGLVRPDHVVRATDCIQQQIAFAQILADKGYTYVIPGDGLYFDTSRLQNYGELARLDTSGLQAGARVPVDGKRTITDFAIWKFSHPGQKRDMEWDSPWGVGFPGWHLECSVIARETLGDQIDIHTGGIDHIPVHHSNEIAQTEAVINDHDTPPEQHKQFSQYWVHNNHLKADGRKMSKSLGNVYTLQDIIDKGYDIDAFKLFALGKHYTTEGNFTWDNLDAAQHRLDTYRQAADLRWQPRSNVAELSNGEYAQPDFADARKQLLKMLQNNLNTPDALMLVSNVCNAIEQVGLDQQYVADFTAFLESIDNLLGLHLASSTDITAVQKQLIAEREQARIAQNWAESDRLRDKLASQGIGLRDTPHGALWHRATHHILP
jgi:cysteinyl-tRNA synthetase